MLWEWNESLGRFVSSLWDAIPSEVSHAQSSTREKTNFLMVSEEIPSSIVVHPYELPNCVIQKEGGLFIQVNNLIDPEAFRMFLDGIFDSGYYFQWLDYAVISQVLYDFEKIELQKKEGKIQDIRFATAMLPINPSHNRAYRDPKISLDRKEVSYYFEKVYIDETDSSWVIREAPFHLDVDMFIAAMWRYGIHHGLDIEGITKAIQGSKKNLLIIATETNPTKGRDATLEPLISFDIRRGIKNPEQARADIHIHERSYIRVGGDVSIYKKNPATHGISGWTVFGTRIEPPGSRDFSLDSYVGIGVRKETRDGQEHIVSNYSGFPRIEERGTRWNTEIAKIHVDDVKTFDKWVGTSTGKIYTDNHIHSSDTVILEVHGKTVLADRDVEASIFALEDITVHGNVYGSTQWNLHSDIHHKISTILRVQLISENGNVSVRGHGTSVYLEAKKGTVKISNLTSSIVVADRIEVDENVSYCTLIANQIIVRKRAYWCRIISGKSIEIAESREKNDSENVLTLFSVDTSVSLEQSKDTIKKMENILSVIRSEMDTSLLTDYPSIEKNISNRETRISVMGILMSMLMDEKVATSPPYKQYIPLFESLRPVLRKCQANWERLQRVLQGIEGVHKKQKEDQLLLEKFYQDSSIRVHVVSGPTHVQYVKFLHNIDLFSIRPEDIDDILFLGKVSKTRQLQKITSVDSGTISWKPSRPTS